MDILTNNEALVINPDSQDEVDPNERDSEADEHVKVVDYHAVSTKTDWCGKYLEVQNLAFHFLCLNTPD